MFAPPPLVWSLSELFKWINFVINPCKRFDSKIFKIGDSMGVFD